MDGDDVVVYIRGINLIYADDGDKTYYHFNAHGDVVVLTNSNGSKTKSYSYNAFGVEYNEAALDSNPFRYCGEYYDKETKTIYLRARYYNAAQGRFTQEDPIRDEYNWYSYCDGNPVNFIDRTGLSFTKMLDITGKGLLKEELLGSSGGGGGANMPLIGFDLYTTTNPNILFNYYRNKMLYSAIKYTNGQQVYPWVSQCKFGFQYMSENGCGAIAIYNAMIGCHQIQQLADIGAFCEQQGGAVLGGYLGMDSSIVAEYFQSQGFTIEVTNDLDMADALLKEYGHAVLLQWNDADDISKGKHYVYIRYESEDKVIVYQTI